MTGALIVGFLLWIPTLFLVTIMRGPWFNGLQWLAAVAPILALLVPGLARPQGSGGVVVAWSVALAPLLAVLGSIAQFFVKRAMNGNVYSTYFENVSSLLVFASCVLIGVVIYKALKPAPSSEVE